MDNDHALPGFAVNGIQLWPDAHEANLWYWLPGVPKPLLTPEGKPQVALLSLGETAILQLGAQWSEKQQVLDKLPRCIVERLKGKAADIAGIRLTPAPAQIKRVVLQIGSEDAKDDVAVGRPSNMVPYAVAISATLDSGKAKAAKAALGGEQGRMLLRYESTVSLTHTAAAHLSGDIAAALPKRPAPYNHEDAARLLAKLETAGTLSWSRTATPGTSQDLRDKVDAAVREKATLILMHSGEAPIHPASSEISCSAELKEVSNCEVVREQDLSNWLSIGDGGRIAQTQG